MKRGGAVLASYNISLADSIGLITATNEALQNPERVGNGLKTIAINLAGIKTSAKDGTMGLNKTAMVLKEIAGVDVYKNQETGELKNMVEILDEVQAKWGKLSDAQQKALSESISGKQQATVFQALMQNYKAFDKIRSEFANGEHFGSAEKENEQYVNSLDGKLNKLKETWLDTFTTIANSDLIYSLLDGLNNISDVINKLVNGATQIKGGLGGLLGGSIFGVKGLTNGFAGKEVAGGFLSAIFGGKTKQKDKEFIEETIGDAQKDIDTHIDNFQNDNNKSIFNFDKMGKSISKFKTSWKDGDKGFKAIGKGIKDIAKESVNLDVVTSSLKGLAGGLIQGRAIGFGVEMIGQAIKALDQYIRRYEIADQKHTERISSMKQEISGYKEQKEAIKGISKEYESLAQKTNRNAEEQARYLEIRQQIAEIMPELVIGSDSEGNPLLALGSSLDGILKQLDQAIAKKERLLRNEQNAQADNILKTANKNNGSLEQTLFDFQRKKEALDRYVFENPLNEQGLFGSFKDFKSQLKDAREYLSSRNEIYKEANESLQEYVKQREDINAKISTKIGNELSSGARYGNYKKATDDIKGQVNQLIQTFDWSRVNLDDQAKLTKGLDNLSKSLTKGGKEADKYSDYLQQIADARANYNASGDEKQYEKDLKGIAQDLSKIMNIDSSTLVNALREGRSEIDVFNEHLSKFLKANKSSYAKFVNGDKNAQDLTEQFRVLDEFVQTGLMGTENLTKEYIVNIKASMPDDMQDVLGEIGKSGFLKDNKVTEMEKEVMLKLAYHIEENGDLEDDVKKKVQDVLSGKLTSDDITSDLTDKNGNVIIPKEMLQSLAMEVQEGMSTLDKVEQNTNKLKEKWAKIKESISNIFGKNKSKKQPINNPTEKSFSPEVGANLDFDFNGILKKIQDKYNKFNKTVTDFFAKFNIIEIIKKAFSGKKNTKGDKIKAESPDVELKEPKLELPKINLWEKIKNWFKNLFNGKKGEKQKVDVGNVEVKEPKLELPKIDIWGKIKEWFSNLTKGKKETKIESPKIKVSEPKIETPKINLWDKIKQIFGGLLQKVKDIVVKIPTVKIKKPKVEVPKIDIEKEIKKKLNKAKNVSINTQIDIKAKANTNKIKSIANDINNSLKNIKSAKTNITFTANTSKATKQINSLLKTVNKYKGKNYHASFIAHTSKAYGKISALISKCKAYGGKTYHASFIAHTSHAYSKVSALLSKAQSYSGRTFHASMTVTTNKVEKIISKPSGKPEAPANLTRTITTTYANDGIMPIDEPTTIDESMSRAKGSSSSTSIPMKDFMIGQMNDAKMSFKDWVNFINKLITDSITNVTNKTESLAEAVKKGATVVLTPIASTVKDILDALKFDVNRLQELENSIKRIAYNIDLLDKRIDRSVGSARIENLKKQNIELKKRIKLNEQLIKQKKKEKEILKQELKKKGLKFTKDDNISNYEETILKLKREMEKLDKASDKLSDKESKRNEKRKKEIEEIIKMMEKFIQLVFTDIPELDLGIMDDKAQIEDNELEIKQIEYEKWVVGLESSFKNVNKELQKLTNQLEMLEVQMEHAWGKEKLDLMNKQIDLIKKSQSALKDNITVMKSAQESAKNKLMEYGFKFNSNGDIENFVEQMNHLKDTSKEFDTIQGLVDGYFDLYLEQIPEAERELAGFTNKIKDIYKEQLNATKELEDKIIDMYKKQLEERKKLIDEELKKRLDALKKEQDAYKRAREEQNYKDDFNEQADKVKEIQKQIDLARKDTSLTGQKKLKDLLKQLEEEKKKLDDITQDRIDQQVDDAFKDEEDRLQQGAEDEKDRLDKEFSDEELLKKAQEAIKNGLFIGIDGEVKNLQSALLEYIDKWEEGLSATGAIIKSEWITNLEIANSLIKDYAGVLDSIGVGSLNTNEIYNKIPNIKPESNSKSSTSINYNQPLVVVQGNVDNNNIEQIKRIVQESIDRNNREILRKI